MKQTDFGTVLRENLAAWRELYTLRRQLFLAPDQLRDLIDLGRQLAALQRDYSRAPTPQIRQEAAREARAVLALMQRYLEQLSRPGEPPPIRLTAWSDRAARHRPLPPRLDPDR